MPRQLRRERDRLRAAVSEREDRREAHVLGPHHERPAPGGQPAHVDELLEHARGHHARGPAARHEPRRARPLAAAGCEHHSRGLQCGAPAWARQLEGPRPGVVRRRPPGNHRLLEHLGTGLARKLRPAVRVCRPGEGAPQVAQPEPLVPCVARDAAGLLLPLEHHHLAHAAPPKLHRRRKPGRPAAHHRHRSVRHHRAPRAARPAGPRTRSPGSDPCGRGCGAAARRDPRAGWDSRTRRAALPS